MSAWISQIASQVEKHGKKEASWYCLWNEPDGTRRKKSCGAGKDGKDRARMMAERIRSQLTLGTYEEDKRKKTTWSEFIDLYRDKGMQGMTSDYSRTDSLTVLRKFGERMKVKAVAHVTDETMEAYVAARLTDRGRRKGETVSGHTVAKELRYLKAALRWAVKRKLLPAMVEIPNVATIDRGKEHVTPQDFVSMLATLKEKPDAVTVPTLRGCDPADWWTALLVYLWETGQRIGATLKLRWSNVDLDIGEATSRAQDTKQRKAATVKLHHSIEHLERIRPVDAEAQPLVFDLQGYSRRTLYAQFERLQKAAGIHLPCEEDHEHTDACHVYGFHAFRYAHSRLNWGREGVDVESLMQQMGHSTRAMAEHYAKDAEAFYRRNDYKPFMPELSDSKAETEAIW